MRYSPQHVEANTFTHGDNVICKVRQLGGENNQFQHYRASNM
jgi:hypothetical protein